MRYLILGTLTTVLLGSYYYFTRRVQDNLNEDDVDEDNLNEDDVDEDDVDERDVDVDLNLSDVASELSDEMQTEETSNETGTQTSMETPNETGVKAIVENLIDDSIDVSDRKKFLLQKKVELNELLEKINMVQMAIKSLH